MRTVKIMCLVLSALSLVAMVQDGLALRAPAVNGTSTAHGILGVTVSLAVSIFWSCALYGIHKRAAIVWRLGLIVIAASYLALAMQASSAILRLPERGDRWILLAVILMGGGAISVYWFVWWYRKRSYFAPRQA